MTLAQSEFEAGFQAFLDGNKLDTGAPDAWQEGWKTARDAEYDRYFDNTYFGEKECE